LRNSSASRFGSAEGDRGRAMLIKDILVHVDVSPEFDPRLHLAIQLARRFDAYVTGVLVLPPIDVLALADSGPVAVELASYLAALQDEAAEAEQRFLVTLRRHGLHGAWRADRGSATESLTRFARSADLVVLRQRDPRRAVELLYPEDVILACGRPVLVVPYAGRFDRVGESVLVGWNASREATLALHEGLPLMAASDSVTLLSAKLRGANDDMPIAELTRHLAKHGLHARTELIEARDADVAEAMNAHAATLGADLIVMGAYGHSRLRETILGGTTQAMLRHMTVPTLMAH
jgi:nucleotide-binding universal stress UspA family protein